MKNTIQFVRLAALSIVVIATLGAMYSISPEPTTGNVQCPSPTVTSSQAETIAQGEATKRGYTVSSTTSELLTFGEVKYWNGLTIGDVLGTGATCTWYVKMGVSQSGFAFTEMHVGVDPGQGGVVRVAEITNDGAYTITVTPTPTGTIQASPTSTVTITPELPPTGTITPDPTATP